MVWDQVPITMVAIDRKIGDFTATLRALVDHWLLLGGVEVFFGGNPIYRESRAVLPSGHWRYFI